jgi:hypothetical protein
MDYRTESFLRKFSDALAFLGGNSIHDLVSIKYRYDTNNAEYRKLINGYLLSELRLHVEEVQGDFQGHAWLVTDHSNNKVLLVEHETGLEILYIAGSIASLLYLIPLVNSGWRFLQSRFSRHQSFRDREAEIELRIISPKNKLVEQRVLSIEDYILAESTKEIAVLRSRVESLERELSEVKENCVKKSASKKPTLSPRKNKK